MFADIKQQQQQYSMDIAVEKRLRQHICFRRIFKFRKRASIGAQLLERTRNSF